MKLSVVTAGVRDVDSTVQLQQIKWTSTLYRRLNYTGNCQVSGCPNVPQTVETLGGNEYQWTPKLVLDHCHTHGWVRGFICKSCNGILRDIDKNTNLTDVYYFQLTTRINDAYIRTSFDNSGAVYDGFTTKPLATLTLRTYQEYKRNCPEC